MRVLVTGGAGFIGSHFVKHLVKNHPSYEVYILDKFTYAGNMENLESVRPQIRGILHGDICSDAEVFSFVDVIVNFAAETHVDNSIVDSQPFYRTNVLGTVALLELCRKHDVRFIQVSTDEVYGSTKFGAFKEEDRLNPRNPYAASKSSADMFVLAYRKTYGLHVNIVRSSNNYGPNQHTEKFIPKCIVNALNDKPLPIYGSGENFREWTYVEDTCRAIDLIMHHGGDSIYNVGSGDRRKNLDIAKEILKTLNKPESLLSFVKDRLGHDFRYALDSAKIRALGWKPRVTFVRGLRKTVDYYSEKTN